MSRSARASTRLLLQRALLAAACLLLSLATLAPPLRMPAQVFDVLAVIDITQSMNVRDYRLDGAPRSRLDFAKHALQQALAELPCGSKLGLAVFTEYRTFVLFTPVDVCRHRAEIATVLRGISGRMAWANASEVAKGLHSALRATAALPDAPALAFITDGHEAPPVNPRYRLEYDGRPGEIAGVIVGVGGPKPLPIPKLDPDGRNLGYWGADEVLQTDLYALGRRGSVSGEQMIDSGPPPAPLPQDQPSGREHLSALHENYLRLLASETGLEFRRLAEADDLSQALMHPRLARPATVAVDVRWLPAALALLALVASFAAPRLGSP